MKAQWGGKKSFKCRKGEGEPIPGCRPQLCRNVIKLCGKYLQKLRKRPPRKASTTCLLGHVVLLVPYKEYLLPIEDVPSPNPVIKNDTLN